MTDFHGDQEINFFFAKKNPKWPIFQNGHFSKKKCENFIDWSLGLVGLVDAKGIDVA